MLCLEIPGDFRMTIDQLDHKKKYLFFIPCHHNFDAEKSVGSLKIATGLDAPNFVAIENLHEIKVFELV